MFKREIATKIAWAMLNRPYKWGGDDPMAGWDCLATGTLVETSTGEVPIECIRSGDMVLTRMGYREVIRAWKVREDAEVVEVKMPNGRSLVGTPEHRVWTENGGWKSLDSLRIGDIVMTCQSNERLLYLTERSSTATRTPPKRRIGNISNMLRMECIIERFGRRITDLFQQVMKYIISMGILSTTPSETSIAFHSLCIGNRPRPIVRNMSTPASYVRRNSQPMEIRKRSDASVQKHVKELPVGEIITTDFMDQKEAKNTLVSYAENASPLVVAKAVDSAPIIAESRFVERKRVSVYDLTVDGEHEFFANGVLVHNCSGLVIEILRSVGRLPRQGDWSAAVLETKFPVVSEPHEGCLVFWTNSSGHINHVAYMLDTEHCIEAGGGGSTTTSEELAIEQNAYVRVRTVASRPGLVGYCDPFAT